MQAGNYSTYGHQNSNVTLITTRVLRHTVILDLQHLSIKLSQRCIKGFERFAARHQVGFGKRV